MLALTLLGSPCVPSAVSGQSVPPIALTGRVDEGDWDTVALVLRVISDARRYHLADTTSLGLCDRLIVLRADTVRVDRKMIDYLMGKDPEIRVRQCSRPTAVEDDSFRIASVTSLDLKRLSGEVRIMQVRGESVTFEQYFVGRMASSPKWGVSEIRLRPGGIVRR